MEFYDFPETVGNGKSSQLTKSIIFRRGRSTPNQIVSFFLDVNHQPTFFDRIQIPYLEVNWATTYKLCPTYSEVGV
jgi:hypothetical protein